MQIKNTIERSATVLGQIMILAGLVYAAWNYGGVTASGLLHISVGSVIALVLATLVVLLRPQASAVSLILPMLAGAFVLYGYLQITTLPTAIASSGIFTHDAFASETIDTLEMAVSKHSMTAVPPSDAMPMTISMNQRQTKISLVSMASALSVLLSVAVFFQTEKSRRWFMIIVVINAVALTTWGIIQRAGNEVFILPGIPYSGPGVPFSSFVYKNAGAAAIVPALAMMATFLMFQDRGRSGQRKLRGSHSDEGMSSGGGYVGTSDLFDVKTLTAVSILLFLLVGLLVSLCRGAWLAFSIAMITAMLINRKAWPTRTQFLTTAGGVGIVIAMVGLFGGDQVVRNRVGDLSVQRVTTDSRWSHWPDGWDTAVANFPMGSGLGTYRYASLSHQREVHGSWYQHAHNQYLEVFAESGVIGVILLLLGLAWLGRQVIRMAKDGQTTEQRQWGMVAMVVLVCGALQSVIDFVLVIPANLALYAAIFGMTLNHGGGHGRGDVRPTQSNMTLSHAPVPSFSKKHQLTMVLASVLVISCLSVKEAVNENHTDQTLQATRIPTQDTAPSLETIEEVIAVLSDAIISQPDNDRLYRRRSLWRLQQARRSIVDIVTRQGMAVTWEATEPRYLFSALASASPSDQQQLCDELWKHQDFESAMLGSMTDLTLALKHGPTIPNYHLSAALLAPLLDMPTAPMTKSLSRLSNNSHDLLYSTGLVSCLSGDIDLAVDLWHRSLSLHWQHTESIYQLASRHVAPEVIAESLIPPGKLHLIPRLVQTRTADDVAYDAESEQTVGRKLIAALSRRTDIDTASRSEWTAKIHSKLGNVQEAADAWNSAVLADSRNDQYRYQYALALRDQGRWQDAIDQASLGAAMSRDDEKFDRLIRQLRQRISSSTKTT